MNEERADAAAALWDCPACDGTGLEEGEAPIPCPYCGGEGRVSVPEWWAWFGQEEAEADE
jgi:DnaJ-class molecular chaperone